MISLAAFLLVLGNSAQAVVAAAPGLAAADTVSPMVTSVAAALQVPTAARTDSIAPSVSGATSVMLVPAALRDRLVETDTVRRRPRAVEMSDAAILRLQIHRYASYTVIPLFALQSIAGNQLYQADKGGAERPGWAKSSHSFGAAALGTVFTVNTVTGLWALWDARANEEGRTRRWAHSLLMLASDAGFTYTGIKLAEDAKNSQSSRDQHRNLAFASMGTALVGYGIMYFGNR
jgi:hypothetical protein